MYIDIHIYIYIYYQEDPPPGESEVQPERRGHPAREPGAAEGDPVPPGGGPDLVLLMILMILMILLMILMITSTDIIIV